MSAQANAVKQQVKANQHAEAGLRQDRLKNAIEHLGADSMSVRLGAAYELFHLASDTDGYCHTVQDILCAHIRQTTSDGTYRNQFRTEPSVEIQSLLSLLFVDGYSVFAGFSADLSGSHLAGTNLRNAHLEGANLTGVCLSEASLRVAYLQGALLGAARLQFADAKGARLQGTILHFADLRCADLTAAQCQGASVYGAQMQDAKLRGAKFHGATDWIDYVTDDNQPPDPNPKGADSAIGSRIPDFAERMRESVGKKSQIGTATFGGAMRPDQVDESAAFLTNGCEKLFRQKMSHHLGHPPLREPPDRSGVHTGSYNLEEAERWISDYPARA